MLKLLFSRLSLALLLFLSVGSSQAALTIEITQGVEGAMPIAVVPFGWQGLASSPPVDIAQVISADLARSGRFKSLAPKDMLAQPHDGTQINFRNWRMVNVDNLVIGKVRESEGYYIVQFQLYDVYRANQQIGYSIRSTTEGLRRTAHQISDLIYESLLGVPGAFATRIAYVTELRKTDGSRFYSLTVADADGYNPRPVLNSREPLMSPAWSPDGKKLAYVSFESKRPAIYIQDVASGKRDRVSSYSGLNGAPAWSPDGRRLALVLSRYGSADIFVLDLSNHRLQRITSSYAIDTEPVWSPDGSALVFTSDRGGSPQLYRIRLGEDNATRLTFEGKYNARAAWSPDGKELAMIHGDGDTFRVAVLELDTGIMRILTDSTLDESPSFAPNGSMIIYATVDKGRGVLSAVSDDGRVKQRLMLPVGDAREPAWSPYLEN